MDLKKVRQIAKERLKPFCRMCPVCDGRLVPAKYQGSAVSELGGFFYEQRASSQKVAS